MFLQYSLGWLQSTSSCLSLPSARITSLCCYIPPCLLVSGCQVPSRCFPLAELILRYSFKVWPGEFYIDDITTLRQSGKLVLCGELRKKSIISKTFWDRSNSGLPVCTVSHFPNLQGDFTVCLVPKTLHCRVMEFGIWNQHCPILEFFFQRNKIGGFLYGIFQCFCIHKL